MSQLHRKGILLTPLNLCDLKSYGRFGLVRFSFSFRMLRKTVDWLGL